MDFEGFVELLLQQNYSELSDVLSRAGDDFDLETKDDLGRTLLFISAQEGLYEGTVLLLALGAHIEARNDSGFTPLHTACENGHYDCAKILIASGANVNNVEQSWASVPLICAAFWGHADVAELLLDARVDVTARSAFDYSALSLACIKGFDVIAQMLLRHGGSDLEVRNAGGSTPLLLAAGAAHGAIVDVLLEYGADVRATDNRGTTLLHILAQTADNATRIREVVSKYAPDVEAKDEDGLTPLHTAVNSGCLENTKVLINHCGADVNATEATGDTALHVAAQCGYEGIFKFLMNTAGINVTIENEAGLKAIDSAYLNQQNHMVQILRTVSSLRPDIELKRQLSLTSPPHDAPSSLARSISAPIPKPRNRSRNVSVSSQAASEPGGDDREELATSGAMPSPLIGVRRDLQHGFKANSSPIPVPRSRKVSTASNASAASATAQQRPQVANDSFGQESSISSSSASIGTDLVRGDPLRSTYLTPLETKPRASSDVRYDGARSTAASSDVRHDGARSTAASSDVRYDGARSTATSSDVRHDSEVTSSGMTHVRGGVFLPPDAAVSQSATLPSRSVTQSSGAELMMPIQNKKKRGFLYHLLFDKSKSHKDKTKPVAAGPADKSTQGNYRRRKYFTGQASMMTTNFLYCCCMLLS